MAMKKLDIYISKSFIKSFFISLIAFVNIFVLSQLFKVFRYVGEGRLTPNEGVLYILCMLPKVIMNVTPLAVLLGALMFISKMASNLEIISLKTAGISFRRIIRFPLIIAFIISIFVFVVNGYLYPVSERMQRELRGDAISTLLPTEKRNGFIRNEHNNLYMFDYLNVPAGEAKGVQVVEMSDDFEKIDRVLFADKASFDKKTNRWVLKNVKISNIDSKTQENLKTYTSDEYDEEPEKFVTRLVDARILTNRELRHELVNLKNTGIDTRDGLSEIAGRYSFPFASFIIVFLGLSLGSRYVRNSSAINVIISVFLGYGYYIVQASFEAYGKNGYLNPFVCGWIPNIIFLLIGIYFVRKAEY